MNKIIIALFGLSLLFVSCASTPQVSRVDANTVVDLDGYWNDSDIRMVCNTLIDDCCDSRIVRTYKKDHGRAPVVIVGRIKNKSDEHIDTNIVAKRFQNAIINSGVMDFVSDKEERQDLREEKRDQAENAYGTAKAMGNETAADFMLLGEINTVVQTVENKSVRAYFVTAQLHDLETNKIVFSAENDSIKKVIKRPKTKF